MKQYLGVVIQLCIVICVPGGVLMVLIHQLRQRRIRRLAREKRNKPNLRLVA